MSTGMSTGVGSGGGSAPDFNALSETEQRAVAERLLRIEESGWRPFWCSDPACPGDPHRMADGTVDPRWAHNHARVDQRLPAWNKPWTLFLMTGRGGGKTRTGVEFVTLSARRGLDGAILGRRGTELVNTHVATLMEHAHPEFRPEFQSSKDLLVWPNGAITYLFSAERPENIRSVNISYGWVDEASHMDEIETAWMNLKLATRIEKPGNPLHFLITSTPTPTQWTMKMEDDPDVEVRRVSTYANRANLSRDFLDDMRKQYEGTRMGRQELHGEVLRDVEGALWNDDMFNHLRVDALEFQDLLDSMDDRSLAVDPAGSKGPRSDATGIIGMGRQDTDASSRFYVLGDATLKGSPEEWAAQVYKAARLWRVNRIVVERNFGGDMVKQVLKSYAEANPVLASDEDGNDFRITEQHAVKGKETRAEPLVGKYEQSCIDGEALVPTQRGVIPLCEVSRNDSVLTRFGLRRVTAVLDQGVKDVVELVTTEGALLLTADHRVFTSNRGWVHACDLARTDTITAWEEYASIAGQIRRAVKQSRGVRPALPGTSGQAEIDNRSASTRPTKASGITSKRTATGEPVVRRAENSCTERSGVTLTAPSLTDGTSTTGTTTRVTTTSGILRLVNRGITRLTTSLKAGVSSVGRVTLSSLLPGRVSLEPASRSTKIWSATNAPLRFRVSSRTPDSATQPVTLAGGIVSVRPAGQRHVYDISVDGHPEFFANGVLVHNCVTHVTSPTLFGDLSELEKEQTTWVPKSRGGRRPSPNRIDAEVWVFSDLHRQVKFAGTMASHRDVMRQLRRRGDGVE